MYSLWKGSISFGLINIPVVMYSGHAKITAFCKTSGKKGIHIFIPLHAQYETDIIVTFAKLVASLTCQRLPDITSIEHSPILRHKKVYLDFL